MVKRESNSRSYNGRYTDRKGKHHRVTVKIVDRSRILLMAGLIALGTMAEVFVVGGAVKEVIDNRFGNRNQEDSRERKPAVVQLANTTEYKDITKNEINSIIAEKPFILKDITNENYTINAGDTLGGIAEKCGNTVNRLCEINGISKDSTIYPGNTLKLEVISDKNPLDKEIAALESYFTDFVFQSPTIKTNHSSLVYGASTNKYTDPKSLLGLFLNYYNIYHAKLNSPNGIEMNDEVKNTYINQLLQLTKKLDELNRNKDYFEVTPYSRYLVYLENGTTEYDYINDEAHTIYR